MPKVAIGVIMYTLNTIKVLVDVETVIGAAMGIKAIVQVGVGLTDGVKV